MCGIRVVVCAIADIGNSTIIKKRVTKYFTELLLIFDIFICVLRIDITLFSYFLLSTKEQFAVANVLHYQRPTQTCRSSATAPLDVFGNECCSTETPGSAIFTAFQLTPEFASVFSFSLPMGKRAESTTARAVRQEAR